LDREIIGGNKMWSYSIIGITDRLIGKVQPIGETNEDEKRLENLKEMYELLDYLVDEMYKVSKEAESHEYSRSKAGNYARNYLKELKIWLDEILTEQTP
jgi:hypothetical protein